MNKQMKAVLSIVLILAVMLMVFSGLHLADLRNQLRDTDAELTESRSTWEAIDSEKRLIQDELKDIRNELKEANQVITELSDIQAEVDELRSQVDAMKTGNN